MRKFTLALASSIILATLIAFVLLSIFVKGFLFGLLGTLLTLLIVLLLIGLTIIIYLIIDNHKKRLSDNAYRIIFFAALFVIGFIIRFSCALAVTNFADADMNFLESLGAGFQTLYYTVAGIGFEGQDIGIEGATRIIAAVAYFGSMLWLAFSFIIIMTAGISYGAYSFFMGLWYCLLGRRSEYYIFTTLSEDSLHLADDIHQEKGDKAYIVFSGDGLEKFDRSNELHKQVRIRKYPYIVLDKRQILDQDSEFLFTRGIFRKQITYLNRSRHTSVLLSLWLLSKKRLKNCSFHIFSMLNDENEKGLESVNSDNVYDDIQGNLYERAFFKKVLRKYLIEDEDNPYFHIDYYVLTNNGMNYEFYAKNFRRVYTNFEKDVKKAADAYRMLYIKKKGAVPQDIEKELRAIETNLVNNKLRKLFKITLINEAYLAGLSLIKKRHEIENKRILEKRIINYTEDNTHSAIILGFGQTGQTALCNLYIDSLAVTKGEKPEESGEQSRFIAHVYDKNIVEYAGQFEQNHPSFLISEVDSVKNKPNPLLEFIKNNPELNKHNLLELKKALESLGEESKHIFANEKSLREYYRGHDFELIDKYLKFPHIYLYSKNGNSLDLLRRLDSAVGVVDKVIDEWRKADSIVIALGDDELNIATANAILQDIRQELYSSKEPSKNKHYVDIYVNIRNEKNRHRLNWNTALENKVHPYINVMPFGNADDMYSFNSIINNLKIKRIDSIYELTGENYLTFSFLEDQKREKVSMDEIKKVYDESNSILDTYLIISGFLTCVRRKDFDDNKETYLNVYTSLISLLAGKVDNNELLRRAFNRRTPNIQENVKADTYNNFVNKWKVNPEKKIDFNKLASDFKEIMDFSEFISITKNLVKFALVSRYEDKYLLDLETFKGYIKDEYDRIAQKRLEETSKNRLSVVMSRNNTKEVTGDLIFHDVEKTYRSFNMDHYSNDSSRFLLEFLSYYDAYFKANDLDNFDYLTRNYFGQFEHARWCRYMFARGTVFTPNIDNPTNHKDIMDNSPIMTYTDFDDKTYSKQFLRLHKDLVPYAIHKKPEESNDMYLGSWLEIYDYINAFCAPFITNEKEEI